MLDTIHLETVTAVYAGPERLLWELLMGEQIHLGGLQSSQALASAAGIAPGSYGVDLCCCTGAGMRFLLHFCGVGRMTGVDATPEVIAEGRRRTAAVNLQDRITFETADVCDTPLDAASADFVWGEDGWCYVEDKHALIREAVRLLKPGGTIAFTDWVAGPVPMTPEESRRFLEFMKFPNLLQLEEYAALLRQQGMRICHMEDTGRFAPCMDLYLRMVECQFAYDVHRILGFDAALVETVEAGMKFIRKLAQDGKVAQGMVVARKQGE